MFKSKRVLSVLLIALMVMSMFGTIFTAGTVAAESENEVDKFVFRPFTPLSSAPKFSATVSTGVVFVCNAESWAKAKDGQYVYLDYGVYADSEPECYKLIKGQNAFSSITDALTYTTTTDIKIGPGVYSEKVAVAKNGYNFYGNFAGTNPNADFDSLSVFYDVPQNPLRADSSLETQVTATWNWQKTTSYITCDGFYITQKGQFFASFSGGNCTNNTFINNIFAGQTTYGLNLDYGSNYNTVVKYNRIIDSTTSTNLLFGAGFYNLDLQYNYFANITGHPFRFTSFGNNNGIESQINISNNIFNNCSSFLGFEVDHNHGKANLIYARLTDNVFYNCGSSAGKIISINYHPDQSGSYSPEGDNMDPASKTFISGNTFYKIASNVSPVKLNGAETIKSKTFFYKVSVVGNRFLFANETGGKAISCTIKGMLDASKNFVGECSKGIGKETMISDVESAFDVAAGSCTYFTMPCYLDYDMTTLSSVVTLTPGDEAANMAVGVAPNGVIVNNDKMEVSVTVADGVETIDLSNVVAADNTTYDIYSDFLLTNKIEDGKLNLIGDRTTAYLVAKNSGTGETSVYTVIVLADSDKAKAELREIVYDATQKAYTDYAVNGKNWNVNLADNYIYFPFSLVVSPSASYKLYTDKELKNAYTDEYFYMQPDTATVIYAAVTSGDGKNTNVYTLSFNRKGSNKYDAEIISAITPEENILIFNNERKRITYRPVIMVTDVVFDFKVSDNATYTIYEDEALTKVLSTSKEPKAITVPDAISTFYIKVDSKFGYSQTYTFMTYNDVKSTDNLVYGVTGLTDVTIENNVITINANATLAVVNAHFDTDVFADVKVYADAEKTFAVEPNLQYITVNKREVEVRTFQLGNSARKSYFYLTVTSETGVPNDYLVILKKQDVSGAVNFTDVKSNHWAKKFIDTASELGLMTGTFNQEVGTYSFYPNNNISRQEVAVVLCTMLGIEPYSFRGVAIGTVFKDANNIPEWSYNYIKAVYALGSMKGDGENFNFKNSITRQEFFVAVAGILKLDTKAAEGYSLSGFKDAKDISSWALASTKAVVKAGIIEGSDAKLNPKANITRAEVATIISKCHKLTK